MIVFQMSGDNPKGTAAVKGPDAPEGTLECTKDLADDWESAGSFFPGTNTYQFTYIAGKLLLLADTRPVVTFSHTPGKGVLVGGDWEFDLVVGNEGDPDPEVTISLVSGTPTRDDLVRLWPSKHFILLKIVSGSVTLKIKTDAPTDYEIYKTEPAQFNNALRVRVRAVDLYAV